MKKVYFAGSIRGGRQDADLYQRIIAALQEKQFIVLTEHVGKVSLESSGEKDMTDKEIFDRDIAWLTESDLVIAECTTPSHGVGYELARARDMGKTIHIFYNYSKGTLSSMLAGDDMFMVHPYAYEQDLFAMIASIV